MSRFTLAVTCAAVLFTASATAATTVRRTNAKVTHIGDLGLSRTPTIQRATEAFGANGLRVGDTLARLRKLHPAPAQARLDVVAGDRAQPVRQPRRAHVDRAREREGRQGLGPRAVDRGRERVIATEDRVRCGPSRGVETRSAV